MTELDPQNFMIGKNIKGSSRDNLVKVSDFNKIIKKIMDLLPDNEAIGQTIFSKTFEWDSSVTGNLASAPCEVQAVTLGSLGEPGKKYYALNAYLQTISFDPNWGGDALIGGTYVIITLGETLLAYDTTTTNESSDELETDGVRSLTGVGDKFFEGGDEIVIMIDGTAAGQQTSNDMSGYMRIIIEYTEVEEG